MPWSTRIQRMMVAAAALALTIACGTPEQAGDSAAASPEGYPEPRWPSYFKPPQSVDDLMPAARALVRNRSGLQGNGLGILKDGDSVLLVVRNLDAEPMVLEAVTRALGERDITPHVKFAYELIGQTRELIGAKRRRLETRFG